jgi:putative glutamine amidotransferase
VTWLVLHPERGAAVPVYTGWLARGGIAWDLISPGQQPPRPAAAYAALLLTGGGDIEPGRYGAAERHGTVSGCDPRRDQQELALTAEFLAARRPVFGICRGLQLLCVFCGGRLIQHLPDWLGRPGAAAASAEAHRVAGADARHPVVPVAGTRLAAALEGVREVNSAHHQGAVPEAPGAGLAVAFRSPAGVIEALEGFGGAAPVSAVQWHPERLSPADPASSAVLAHWQSLAAAGRTRL